MGDCTMIITVLNGVKDARGNVVEWRATVLDGVRVERKKSGSGGTETQRTSTLLIWTHAVFKHRLSCVPKRMLLSDRSGFSLDAGEYIIPGICTDIPPVSAPIKGFLQTHDVMQITGVEECFYGSASMQHWEVTCQ